VPAGTAEKVMREPSMLKLPVAVKLPPMVAALLVVKVPETLALPPVPASSVEGLFEKE